MIPQDLYTPQKNFFNIRSKLVVLFLFSSVTAPVFSQTVKILVKDQETKQVISQANLGITSITSSKKIFKLTNTKGLSSFLIPQKSILEITAVGYKPVIDTIYPNTNKTYFLETDVFNLEQVIITATRTKKPLKNSPTLTQIITGEQIRSRGIQSLQDVLTTDIPLISFNQAGFGTNINAQGLNANAILVLVDGERLAGETGSNIDYSRINTQDIERVEIIRGASSTLYGSQAMGAVINIITKKPQQAFSGSIAMQYTTPYDTNYPSLSKNNDNYSILKNLDKPNLNQDYMLGITQGKWRAKTNLTYKSADAYQLFDTDSVVKNYTAIDSIVYVPKKSQASHSNGYEDYSLTQAIDYTFNQKVKINSTFGYYQHQVYDYIFDNKHDRYKDFNYTLKTTYKASEKTQYLLSFRQDTYSKYNYLELLSDQDLKYRHQIQNPKVSGIFQLNDKQNLSVGMEYLSESLLSTFFVQDAISKKSMSTSVLFMQDDINFRDKWNLILGIRSEYHSSFGAHFTPKIALMYKNYPITLRTNFASGYRSPNLKELYMDWDLLGMFTIKGNEDLKPETSNYFAGSLEYSHPKINASISFYKNKFKNKIEGLWRDNQTIYQYYNTKSSDLTGVDLLIQYQPIRPFRLQAGYSFVMESPTEGIRISSGSPHNATLQLNYQYQTKKYKLKAALTGKYTGPKDFKVIDELSINDQIIEAAYPVHYDGYSIWRFSLNQQYKNFGDFSIGVNNLLDYHAPIVTFDTFTDPGRSFFMGVHLHLESFINI